MTQPAGHMPGFHLPGTLIPIAAAEQERHAEAQAQATARNERRQREQDEFAALLLRAVKGQQESPLVAR